MKGIVWGSTIDRAKNKLNEIIEQYEIYQIKITNKREGQNCLSVIFDNGDCWKIAKASENSKGYRANISYVDILIDPDIFYQIIRPCTYTGPYYAFNFYWPEDYVWVKGENPYLKFIK